LEKSFTLIEVLVTAVIIFILVGIGATIYKTQLRKAYITSAGAVLHQIRASILRYIKDEETFPAGWADLDISNPSNADWNYTFSGNVSNFTITAVKQKPPYKNLSVQIDKAGTITVH